MEYLTNLIGKQVLSIYENEIIGTVLNAQFSSDYSKVAHLIVLSEDEETVFLLPTSFVFGIDNYITIKNKSGLIVSVEPAEPTALFRTATGLSGKSYGKIMEIGLENWRTQLFFADTTIEYKKLFSTSPSIMLINDLDKKTFLFRFAPKKKPVPPVSSQLVTILTENSAGIAMPKTITAKPVGHDSIK